MVGKRDSFPFWSSKSLVCRGEQAAVSFREAYDVTVSWTFRHYLFWDPYNFSSQNRFPDWTGEGMKTKDAKIRCVSLLVDIYFFEIRGKLVGVFWKFEGLNATLPPVSFLKANRISCLLLRNGGDVRKVFVLVSQVDFFLHSSSKYQT